MNGLAQVMDHVSRGFEIAGVVIIIIGFGIASVRATSRALQKRHGEAYEAMRATFGRSVLLGLEILVAADIVRTVAIKPTLQSLWVLGLLVVIRTFLSWALEVEIDGRWPWQRHREIRRRTHGSII